jgi:S-adenosylmethionine:tRNA ribosyltransferase-isomerase
VRHRDGRAAQVSVTLIERIDDHRWQALARPAKRLKPGDRITFGEGGNVCLLGSLAATVEGRGEEGEVSLAFELGGVALDDAVRSQGAMPLPPYIASRRAPDERDRSDYQTVFRARGGRSPRPPQGCISRRRSFRRLTRAVCHATS